jgi:glycosyltransferase involved in cell wall biosynthesis
VTVLVAARDEAAVLPRLVADVAAQDHREPDGTPRFELLVVDDRSTDGSGPIVRRAAESLGIAQVTRVMRRGPAESAGAAAIARADLPDGKGAALTTAPPEACRGEIVIVLDADARIAPDFLRRAASYPARGAPAVTARRRVRAAPSGSGWLGRVLAAVQDDEQTADGALQRGRWALGGCSEFRGNGMIVTRDRLAAAGGWRAQALCEDLDLSTRLAVAEGIRVGWAIDVVVREEPVTSLAALWRQRCRWAEGIVRRQLDLTRPVLASRALSTFARADYLAYSAQTVAPLAILGALAEGLRRRDPRRGIALAAIYLGAGAALAADALRSSLDADGLRSSLDADGRPPALPVRLARALRVTAFSAHWLAVVPVAWARVALGSGPLHYAKMAHGGAPAETADGRWVRRFERLGA